MAALATADVVINHAALEEFLTSPAGPVGQLLARLGKRVSSAAKDRAPVSPHGSHGRAPGHLKHQIRWRLDRGSDGLYVDIWSPARTADGRNAPYGLFQSLPVLHGAHGQRIKTTPHLQPALEAIIGSL